MRLWTFFVSLFLSFSLIIFPPVEAKQIKSSVKTSEVIKKTSSVNEIKKSKQSKQTIKSSSAKKSHKKIAVKSHVRSGSTRSTSRKFARASQRKSRYGIRRVRGPSYAQLMGLRGSNDPLGLKTTAVLAYDMDSNKVLYEKNAEEPLPIASVTKLMTALVIVESGVKLSERFKVTNEDRVKSRARSKLRPNMVITRKEALHLALMSSDNRAAHFLARTYPGGKKAFIKDMNTKAALLGMYDTVFYDSIGLDNGNKSSAENLSHLIASASEYEIIRDLSTTPRAEFHLGRRFLTSGNTNRFVTDQSWDVELQKTGLTTAAGYCMVMQTNIKGHSIAIIFLDSPNKSARNEDAEKLRRWLASSDRIQTAAAE